MKRGLSIIEVLIALAIIAIMIAAVIPVFSDFLRTNTDNEIRSQAVVAAQQNLEQLRRQFQGATGTLPNSGSTTQTIAVGGRSFVVTTYYCENPAWCSANTRQLRVAVNFGGRDVYTAETVYTRFD